MTFARCFTYGSLLLISLIVSSHSAEIQEVALPLRGLAYDPFTAKLYATSPDHTNKLLQLGPDTGGTEQTRTLSPTTITFYRVVQE